MTMKYGIEAYFVQQGKGLEMEKKMGILVGNARPGADAHGGEVLHRR